MMRSVDTPSARFRQLVREVSLLLGYDALKDLELTTETIQTPLARMDAPVLKGKKLALVSILRAGNGLLEGFLDLVPSARVGHIGLYRDPETLEAVEYYLKLPEDIGARKVVVVDPMLATANSSIAAITRLKEAGAKDIVFVCVLAAPEGIEAFSTAHPDVPIFTAAIDSHLNDHGYIVPGLGDAGDRIYGTK
jgi:uracil phosphoribosyltransferase